MDRLLLNTGPVCCETLASTTFLITQLFLPLVLLLRRHSCDLIRHSLWKSILLIQSLSLSPWAFMLFKLGRVENSCIVVDCQRQSSWTQTEHLNLRAEFRSPFAVLDSQLYRGQWTFLFMQRLTRCCLVFESHSLYCRRLQMTFCWSSSSPRAHRTSGGSEIIEWTCPLLTWAAHLKLHITVPHHSKCSMGPLVEWKCLSAYPERMGYANCQISNNYDIFVFWREG